MISGPFLLAADKQVNKVRWIYEENSQYILSHAVKYFSCFEDMSSEM